MHWRLHFLCKQCLHREHFGSILLENLFPLWKTHTGSTIESFLILDASAMIYAYFVELYPNYSDAWRSTEGINLESVALTESKKSIACFELKFLLTISLWFTFLNSVHTKFIVKDVGKHSLAEETMNNFNANSVQEATAAGLETRGLTKTSWLQDMEVYAWNPNTWEVGTGGWP